VIVGCLRTIAVQVSPQVAHGLLRVWYRLFVRELVGTLTTEAAECVGPFARAGTCIPCLKEDVGFFEERIRIANKESLYACLASCQPQSVADVGPK